MTSRRSRRRPSAWVRLRRLSDRLTVWLPVMLMGLLALGTYWLARNAPVFTPPQAQAAPTHDPDYFMRGFSVRTFDPSGRLKSEVVGTEARHYPDTDTLEIDQPRIRSFNERGDITVATARSAISNGDGTEVQLIGDAVVTRAADGTRPRLEFRGEFLHAFLDTERVKSHKPVVLIRGNDRFTADSLEYDNLDRVAELRGRVRGLLLPAPGGD
jgi:lipopolysaccharide export system protein LptC